MTLETLSPARAQALVAAGDARIVDIRDPDEFARCHIPGALSLPLASARRDGIRSEDGRPVIFTCRSGMRTAAHCDRLADGMDGKAYVLEGGLEGWRKAGLPVAQDRRAPIELMRQVQIAAGLLVLAGLLLGWLFAWPFFLLSAFVGGGLTVAGVTGTCAMARLLALAPWNRRALAA